MFSWKERSRKSGAGVLRSNLGRSLACGQRRVVAARSQRHSRHRRTASTTTDCASWFPGELPPVVSVGAHASPTLSSSARARRDGLGFGEGDRGTIAACVGSLLLLISWCCSIPFLPWIIRWLRHQKPGRVSVVQGRGQEQGHESIGPSIKAD